MKKSVEILGLPIISITEGRELGVSKSLLIDAKNGVVAAITIDDDDWYRGVKLIPYEAIIAIGKDAVTITHSENILNLEEAGDYERLLVENIRVIGTKAITKSGRIQGKVTEVFVGEGGRIEKCEITAPDGSVNEVTAEQISIFGKQVTVIDIDEEKKNNLTDKPAFEPAFEAFSEEPAQEVWSPPVEETQPEPEFTLPPVEETQPEPELTLPTAEETQPEPEFTLPTAEENQPEPELTLPPVEETQPEPELTLPPVEEATTTEETQAELENVMTPEPAEEKSFEPVEPPKEEQPPVAEDDKKIATMTRQAEDLKAALKKARASQQVTTSEPEPKTSQKKHAEKAVDERRRRVLLGKHATKTIITEGGTVVVESGAEVTEEVLQRARLSNKFIELSMNVQ